MTRILVIEDEGPVRANILELLEAEGFGVMGAANGFAGVQQAREHLPDLIICDVMMPGLDGLGVLAALREDMATATIPFIFLTARTERTDLRMGMELGADDYLTKPFTRAELLKAINTRLAKQVTVSEKYQKKMEDLRDSITLSLPHELRTPLTFILGFAEMLIEYYDSMERQEILEMAEKIHIGAQRLERLVLNFLLYAELEVAAEDPERIKALLGSGVCLMPAGVTDIAIQKAQQAGREADLSLDIEDIAVQIPEASLKKIIEELVDNAFKYSQSGTPVHMAGRSDNNRFVLTITDNGQGMTAEQIANVGAYMQFERKLHEQQGSGFGLTIAKRLAELHGGELTIESVPGKQTTVRVVLPM
jgi:two-component system, sensor histidine kinase and response regulator